MTLCFRGVAVGSRKYLRPDEESLILTGVPPRGGGQSGPAKMTIKPFNGVTPFIEAGVYVDETALVIGDVSIGAESSIWPMTVVRGDVNRIRIGHHTNIQDGCVLHVTHASEELGRGGLPLIVGSFVTVGHKVLLHACTVGDYCLIGMGAIIMDGVAVQDRVIVGAGSLVTPGKTLESGFLYVGNPARKSRPLTAEEQALLEYLPRHYVELKNRHSGGHA